VLTEGDQLTLEIKVVKGLPTDPGRVTDILEVTGNITVGGSADINGTTTEGSTFSFNDVFGTDGATLKNDYSNVVVDPANNYQPVEGLTWFETDTATKVSMTNTGWSGSGVMVVEGDLQITGGTFNGIIWVTGNCDLDVSGNVNINGAIFVEGDASLLVGNPTLTFSGDEVDDALGGLDEDMISWKEVYTDD